MEITATQRLILASQYKLMALLGSENAKKYQRLETIAKGGCEKELTELDKEFSDLSEAEYENVLNTPEMYHALQVSYNNLEDKSALTPHRLQFTGHCTVREKKYLNYLRFITGVEGKYQEFMHCEYGCDAQVQMWEKYQRMLNVWKNCPHGYHLSMTEIQNILNA